MSLRLTGIVLAAILTAAIIWAFLTASFWESFGRIIVDPWGIVTLIDLYAGFVVSSVFILAIERGRWFAWALIIPIFLLGNVVTALWLAWRAAKLAGMLSRQPEAA